MRFRVMREDAARAKREATFSVDILILAKINRGYRSIVSFDLNYLLVLPHGLSVPPGIDSNSQKLSVLR